MKGPFAAFFWDGRKAFGKIFDGRVDNNGKRNKDKEQKAELDPPRGREIQGGILRAQAGHLAHVSHGAQNDGSRACHRLSVPGGGYGGGRPFGVAAQPHFVKGEVHGGKGTAQMVYPSHLFRIRGDGEGQPGKAD